MAEEDFPKQQWEGLEADKGTLIHRGQWHHTQIDPEAADGEAGVAGALVGGPENADKLRGEELHNDQGSRAHNDLRRQQPGKQLPGSVTPPSANVAAHDQDAPSCQLKRDGDDNLEKFHYYFGD